MCKGCLYLREMNLCFYNIVLLTGGVCIGSGIDSRLTVLGPRAEGQYC